MEEISKSLKPIFDKLSDFFNLFDLSFFVSGSLSTGFIYLWMNFKNITPPITELNKYTVFILLLSCYIMGLFSFAIGRIIRRKIFPWNDNKFVDYLDLHQLTNYPVFTPYINANNIDRYKSLYVRAWAEIRSKQEYSKSFSFLNRYWVMTATYDGLLASLLIALSLLFEAKTGIIFNSPVLESFQFYILILITCIFFLACLFESKRYQDYQIEEVICTIACNENNPPQNPPAQPVVPIPNGIPPTPHTITTTTTTTITVP